jgi:hypothetical protein
MSNLDLDRLDLAEKVLAHWDVLMNLLGASAVDKLQLLEAEALAMHHFRKVDAERADDLERRFKALASQTRLQIN